MRVGWRTITAIKRFLCERQNVLVKEKANLKDVSFGIKLDRFNDLLKQINEDVLRNNPISPDLLQDILEIFLKDKVITSCKADRNRYLVSEATYQASGITMESLRRERSQLTKEESVPACSLISGAGRQERPIEQKVIKQKPKPPAPKEKKKQRQVITPIIVHENIKCRECLLVDGYLEQEKNCRHCGAKLFKNT